MADFANAVAEAAAKERIKVKEKGGFGTPEQRQWMIDQISTAEFVARMVFDRSLTTYPTGCTVYVALDGHAPTDILNYAPHHIGVRLSIVPVPHHR
jgi:hypothetical protein